jgi:hypothetical protein
MTIRNFDTIAIALDRVIHRGDSPHDVAADLRLHVSSVRRWMRLHRALVDDGPLSREIAAYVVQSDSFQFRMLTADHGGWSCIAELADWAYDACVKIDIDRIRFFACGLPVPYLDTPAPSPEPVTAATAEPVSMTRADLLRDISARLHDLSELVSALAEVTHD